MKTKLIWTILEQEHCAQSMRWMRDRYQELPHLTALHTLQLAAAQGRQDRTWFVRDGQLLLTLLFKPSTPPPDDPTQTDAWWATFAMACSLGIQQPLADYAVGLKWPNDLVAKGKKLGGVLIHTVWEGAHPAALIVGIGLNINNNPSLDPELASIAISLSQLSGTQHPLCMLHDQLLTSLATVYTQWQTGSWQALYTQWRQLVCANQQTIVQTHDANGTPIHGRIVDALADGSIALQKTDGSILNLPWYLTPVR